MLLKDDVEVYINSLFIKIKNHLFFTTYINPLKDIFILAVRVKFNCPGEKKLIKSTRTVNKPFIYKA